MLVKPQFSQLRVKAVVCEVCGRVGEGQATWAPWRDQRSLGIFGNVFRILCCLFENTEQNERSNRIEQN